MPFDQQAIDALEAEIVASDTSLAALQKLVASSQSAADAQVIVVNNAIAKAAVDHDGSLAAQALDAQSSAAVTAEQNTLLGFQSSLTQQQVNYGTGLTWRHDAVAALRAYVDSLT